MSSIEYCIQKARELPYIKGEQRHYSLILDKRGKILAESANSYTKSSPKMMRAGKKVGLDLKIYWHSECRALYSVKNVDKIHKLIVVRVDAKGNPAPSHPCIICSTLAREMGVKSIEYSL